MKLSVKSLKDSDYSRLSNSGHVHAVSMTRNSSIFVKYLALCFLISCLLLGAVVATVLLLLPKYPKCTISVRTAPEPVLATRRPNPVSCDMQLVESIPIGLNYSAKSPKFLSTYDAWTWLLNNSNKNLDIGSFYWTLLGSDVVNHSSANLGEDIFNRLLANGNAVADHKLQIRIAQSQPTEKEKNLDTELLKTYGAADVVSVNFPKYFGGGVLHTKVWIVDQMHFYLGSANMDWRSLTQVKEMGVLAKNCPDLARDMQLIFEEYWYLGSRPNEGMPNPWPYKYNTQVNARNPLTVNFTQNFTMAAYFSSSPPPLSAKGRTHDLDAILNTINSAIYYVHIAVMDYYPLLIYTQKKMYWPYIDNALRRAAVERNVSVKLLISWWKHSNPSEDNYLKSLQDLSNLEGHIDLEVRRFVVPSDDDQAKIPYGRVNHNKYMVTDNVAYIGTSNWSGDYFTNTAGIGLILKDNLTPNQLKSLRTDLTSVFERDWNSIYAMKF